MPIKGFEADQIVRLLRQIEIRIANEEVRYHFKCR
jgi:hypothetical protein